MDDLISRKAAIDATWFEPYYTDPLNVLTEVRDRLEALPSAQETKDAVEVVRCKDCKHNDGSCCDYSAVYTRPNGYCQWGERKDGEQDE